MKFKQNPDRLIRKVTRFTLGFIMLWGLVIVLAQVRPFWVDEWRIMYNLKFKTFTTIFGPLDYMQQFPRVYLWLIKCFASPFDYSYFTLRLPSYLVGVATMLLCYRLMTKLYAAGNVNRYLFVLVLVSSFTFTEYLVQIKQYTMDISLSLLAIYQLLELLSLHDTTKWNKRRYALLCASFVLAPFFSYTYPLVVAPIYAVILVDGICVYRHSEERSRRLVLLRIWLPLLLAACAIGVFYMIDARQVTHDGGMRLFWAQRLMTGGFDWRLFLSCSTDLFANVGRGLLFQVIFGIVGISAFLYGGYKSLQGVASGKRNRHTLVLFYSVSLQVMLIALFCMGKFPLGEPRLNAFAVPSITILIIALLDKLKTRLSTIKLSHAVALLLYVGVVGNVYNACFKSFTGTVFNRKLAIYETTEDAIILAQARRLPIVIAPKIAYPFDNTINYPFQGPIPGDWVLKSFPAYKIYMNLPVYAINDLADVDKILQGMPNSVTAILAGNGESFHIVRR